MNELLMLDKTEIDQILEKPKLKEGLASYKYIMNNLYSVDVSKNIEFQHVYSNFYRLGRRPSDMKDIYFAFMESKKNLTEDKKNSKLDITEVVNFLHDKTNKIELSFSSKFVHTLNPEEPIYDRELAKFFKCKYWEYHSKDERIQIYNKFKSKFLEFKNSDTGKLIIKMFNEKFPNYKISDTKKIDFVLWQNR